MSVQVIFRKRALQLVALLRNMTCNLGHPMGTRHPVVSSFYPVFSSRTGMGWLRLVGSLKSEVSFAEYRLSYRALLQKRPIILRSLRIVATPYCLLSVLAFVVWSFREVGGWGRDPFSRNFMKPTPRRKWYLTTGRRFH